MLHSVAVGMIVKATQGTKVQYEQEFLYKDHGQEATEEKARKNHKHIRDTFPDCIVELNYVWEALPKP